MTISEKTMVRRTIHLSPEEHERLLQISREEHMPEAVLLKKLILDGLEQRRIERACAAYANGELNLSGAARYAGIGVEEMMRELEQRGIDYGPTLEQYLDGLEFLLDTFGDDTVAREVIAEVRQQEELITV